jgi:hypothetical protein
MRSDLSALSFGRCYGRGAGPRKSFLLHLRRFFGHYWYIQLFLVRQIAPYGDTGNRLSVFCRRHFLSKIRRLRRRRGEGASAGRVAPYTDQSGTARKFPVDARKFMRLEANQAHQDQPRDRPLDAGATAGLARPAIRKGAKSFEAKASRDESDERPAMAALRSVSCDFPDARRRAFAPLGSRDRDHGRRA